MTSTAVWQVYGSNFYLPVMDLQLNANDARTFCEKEGGDLASVEFGGENDYLKSLIAAAPLLADGSLVTTAHIGLYYDDWWN